MPLILLLVLLVLFSPLAIDIYLPAIPQMAEQLGAEVTLMQGTITWFLFSMGLGQLLVGPLQVAAAGSAVLRKIGPCLDLEICAGNRQQIRSQIN